MSDGVEFYLPCDLCLAPAVWNVQAEASASACGRHLHRVAQATALQGSDLRILIDYLPGMPSDEDLPALGYP